jgi:hypothetical protein
MRRALLKPETSGPEAIEPDCFGESRRDGPSKPERRVLVFSSTEIITGAMRGLSSVETTVDHGFGESWLVGSGAIEKKW